MLNSAWIGVVDCLGMNYSFVRRLEKKQREREREKRQNPSGPD